MAGTSKDQVLPLVTIRDADGSPHNGSPRSSPNTSGGGADAATAGATETVLPAGSYFRLYRCVRVGVRVSCSTDTPVTHARTPPAQPMDGASERVHGMRTRTAHNCRRLRA
jgi:hypothetical protein